MGLGKTFTAEAVAAVTPDQASLNNLKITVPREQMPVF